MAKRAGSSAGKKAATGAPEDSGQISFRVNRDAYRELEAGHAHGKIKGGQHVKYPQDSRFADLLVTLFDRNNIPIEKIGDSGGIFSEV